MTIMLRICQKYFYSKSRARLSHAVALHNLKQGQEWINYNYSYKPSLLNITKICMDLSVASSLHGNKITADKRNHQVPEIRNITEPSLHACASHHRGHKNTWHTPLERWHGTQQNTCRVHAHKMHRLNDTKITNLQVLLRASR